MSSVMISSVARKRVGPFSSYLEQHKRNGFLHRQTIFFHRRPLVVVFRSTRGPSLARSKSAKEALLWPYISTVEERLTGLRLSCRRGRPTASPVRSTLETTADKTRPGFGAPMSVGGGAPPGPVIPAAACGSTTRPSESGAFSPISRSSRLSVFINRYYIPSIKLYFVSRSTVILSVYCLGAISLKYTNYFGKINNAPLCIW